MPPSTSWMQSPVESLKDSLLGIIDDKNKFTDESQAADVIRKLEESSVTKEFLEGSRLGAIVNDVRKRIASSHPALSKRLRHLIKRWQEQIQLHSIPLGTSTHGTPVTPAGISPAVRNRLVASSAGSSPVCQNQNKGTTSPFSSSYAPNETASNSSQSPKSVGIKLKIKVSNAGDTSYSNPSYSIQQSAVSPTASDTGSNASRKRKGSTPPEANGRPLVNGVGADKSGNPASGAGQPKRICVRQSTNDSTSSTPCSSIRPKLKTTAEILADVNKSLPTNMTINLGGAETQDTGTKSDDSKRVNYAQLSGVSNESSKYVKKVRLKVESSEEMTKNKNELMQKFLQETVQSRSAVVEEPIITEDEERNLEESVADTGIAVERRSAGKNEPLDETVKCLKETEPKAQPRVRRNWYSILPPLDVSSLDETDAGLSNPDSPVLEPAPIDDRSICKVKDREVLRLPYVDVGIPDFIQFKFPDRMRYLSDLNWLYKKPEDFKI